MNSENYNRLCLIFENYRNSLIEEERDLLDKALRAYNSQLFVVINKLKEIPNYIDLNYQQIANVLLSDVQTLKIIKNIRVTCEKYNNGELKGEEYKFLSLISLSRKFSEFIDSIINISDILDRHIGMIVIDRDIDLYRGFNAKEGEEKISRSEYISTSTSIDVAKCFIHNDKLYKNSLGDVKQLDKHIVHLKVKAGVPFMIFPFNKEQNEILIFANTLDIKLINKNTKNMYGWYNYIEEEYICSLKKDYKLNLDNISK